MENSVQDTTGRLNPGFEQKLKQLLLDEFDGQQYIFDPESADIHLIPHSVAEAIAAVLEGQELSSDQCLRIQETLFFENRQLPSERVGPDFRALTLHLNHACNMACVYCYADGRGRNTKRAAKGAYGGPVELMSSLILNQAIDKFMRDSPTDKIAITLLGGEPLLSESRFLAAIDMIDSAARGANKQVIYKITTNGTKMADAVLRCLKDHAFSIGISLDGERATHDQQRPMANGDGSYDLVTRTMTRLLESDVPFGVRMTAFRRRSGFEENHISLTRTPAVSATFQFDMYGPEAQVPLESKEEEALFAHYLEITRRILRKDEAFAKLDVVRTVLERIVTKRKQEFQCGAGRWDFAVVPNGDVYPCHRFVGMNRFRIGNVSEESFRFEPQFIFERNAVRYRVSSKDGKPYCASCYARYICGGGCPQVAAMNTGSIDNLPIYYCEEARLRVRAVVQAIVEQTFIQSRHAD